MSVETVIKAVLFADLVGYSRLVGEDEQRTLAFMDRCFAVVGQECAARGGDLVKTTGDGFVALFGGASVAVDFALSIHRLVAAQQAEDSPAREFRIGIHLGEVRRDASDVYGHPVNIAARLEALAAPGSTLVSHDVYRLSRRNTGCRFEAAGVPVLKNIRDRIPVYRVVEAPGVVVPERVEPLWISVIGGLSVSAPSGDVKLPNSDAVHGLIGCLALGGRHQETQAKLAALLWPDRTARDARRALGRCLRLARRTVAPAAPDALGGDDNRLWLDELSVTVDLDRMLANLKMGRVDDILLEDLDWDTQILPRLDRLNPLLTAWAKVARKRWRRDFANAFESCLERFEPSEEGARRSAVALLNLEPGHEPASRILIQHHIDRGNRAAALREYERLVEYLADKFGIGPSSEIVAIVARLSSSRGPEKVAAPERASRATGLERLQITVAEFSGGGEGEAHLVFGFRNEIIANLSRFREWSVLERGGRGVDPAAGTGVGRYTLEGDLGDPAKGGGLMLRLLEDDTRRVVWSESLEIAMADWHKLQRLVVGRIAATLEIYMSADRLAHAIAARGGEAVSFDDWLRGERLLSRWTPEADDEAAEIFKHIIARDPMFAPAYASLASIHNVRHVIRPGRPRDAQEDLAAHRLGQRAVELDPMDARNHLAVAWTAALTGAFDQAVVHLDLAVTLNPFSPRSLISAAMGYAFFGDSDQAVELLGRARSIAPMLLDYQWCYVAAVWFLASDYDAAVEATARSGNKIVDNQGWRAAALANLGRGEAAARAFADLTGAVAPIWAGPQPLERQRIFDWFVTAYPIRHAEDRKQLSDALAIAAAEGRRPAAGS